MGRSFKLGSTVSTSQTPRKKHRCSFLFQKMIFATLPCHGYGMLSCLAVQCVQVLVYPYSGDIAKFPLMTDCFSPVTMLTTASNFLTTTCYCSSPSILRHIACGLKIKVEQYT